MRSTDWSYDDSESISLSIVITLEQQVYRPTMLERPGVDSNARVETNAASFQENPSQLALAFINRKDYRGAALLLEQVLTAEPNSIPVRSLLAETYFWSGRFDDCRSSIEHLVRFGVDTPLGRLGLAVLDVMAGKRDEALANLQRAESCSDNPPPFAAIIAELYLRLRCIEDATRVLNRALAKTPDSAPLHSARSLAFLLSREIPAAENAARQAIELEPASFSIAYRHGVILQRLRRHEEAVNAFKSALTLATQNAGIVHRRLAESFQRLGQDAMALHHHALSIRARRPRTLPGLNIDWPDQLLPLD